MPIGRRAEEIAHRFLLQRSEELAAKNIRWISQEGLTPGWDLQYENDDGEVIAVELREPQDPCSGALILRPRNGMPRSPWRITTGSISLLTAAEQSQLSNASRTLRVF